MNKITGRVFLDGSFRLSTVSFNDVITGIETLDERESSMDLPIICPGLIDVHIHGFKRNSAMGGRESVKAMAEGLAHHGVTSFLPTTVTASIEDTHAALEGITAAMDEQNANKNCCHAANVLGAHMEGPFINEKYKGAHDEKLILPPTLEAYNKMTHGVSKCVKLMTIAPELDGAPELIDMLRGKIRISCGHSAATARCFYDGVNHGVSHVTHLFNAMSPLHHREPGVVGAALSDGRVTVELIADGIHVHKTVLDLAAKLKGTKCVLITDAMEATGLGEGEYMLGGLKVIVSDGAARLPSGTLAGSTLTLDKALRNMIIWGTPPTLAVQMATSNPADMLGLADRGRIAVGLRADIITLSSEWEVMETYILGKASCDAT